MSLANTSSLSLIEIHSLDTHMVVSLKGLYTIVNLEPIWVEPMFVERKVRYSALFTNLVGWHAGAVSFHLSDVILAQLACPLSDIMFFFTFRNN